VSVLALRSLAREPFLQQGGLGARTRRLVLFQSASYAISKAMKVPNRPNTSIICKRVSARVCPRAMRATKPSNRFSRPVLRTCAFLTYAQSVRCV